MLLVHLMQFLDLSQKSIQTFGQLKCFSWVCVTSPDKHTNYTLKLIQLRCIIMQSLYFNCSYRRFEKKHLAQMKTVYPSSLEFRQDKCTGKSSSFELIVEFGKTEESYGKLTLTATELLARKDVFQKNLLKLTKKHHQVLLLYNVFAVGSVWVVKLWLTLYTCKGADLCTF